MSPQYYRYRRHAGRRCGKSMGETTSFLRFVGASRLQPLAFGLFKTPCRMESQVGDLKHTIGVALTRHKRKPAVLTPLARFPIIARHIHKQPVPNDFKEPRV
jgi:hypothetical protein